MKMSLIFTEINHEGKRFLCLMENFESLVLSPLLQEWFKGIKGYSFSVLPPAKCIAPIYLARELEKLVRNSSIYSHFLNPDLILPGRKYPF